MTVDTVFARLRTLATSPEIRAIDPGLGAWLARNEIAVRGVLAKRLAGSSDARPAVKPWWPDHLATERHRMGDIRDFHHSHAGLVQALEETSPEKRARHVFYPEGVTPPKARPSVYHQIAQAGLSVGRVYRTKAYTDASDLAHPPGFVRFQVAPDGSGIITVETMHESRRSPSVGPMPLADGEGFHDLLRSVVSTTPYGESFPHVVEASRVPDGPSLAVNTVVTFKGRKGKRYVVVKPGTVVDIMALSGSDKGSEAGAVRTSDLVVHPGIPQFEGKGAHKRWRAYAGRMAMLGYSSRALPWVIEATAAPVVPVSGIWQAAPRKDALPEGMDRVPALTDAEARRLFNLQHADEIAVAQRAWEAARAHRVATAPPDVHADRRLERVYSRVYFGAQQAANDLRIERLEATKAAVRHAQAAHARSQAETELTSRRTMPTVGPTRLRGAPELPSGQDALAAWTIAKAPSGPPDAAPWLAFRHALLTAAAAKGDAVKTILGPALIALTDSGAADAGSAGEKLTNTGKGLYIAMLQWLDTATLLMPEYLDAQGEYAGDSWADGVEEAIVDAKFRLEHPKAKTAKKGPFPPDWAFRFAQTALAVDKVERDWESAPTVPAIRAWAQWAATAPEAQLPVRVWTTELVKDWHRQAAARRALGQPVPMTLREVLAEYGVLPPADLLMFPTRNPRR